MKILYIRNVSMPFSLDVQNLTQASGSGSVWGENKVIIKAIKVVTNGLSWTLRIFSDSDGVSGAYDYITIGSGISGNKDFILNLPYIDNDAGNGIHVQFLGGIATFSVYAIKAS